MWPTARREDGESCGNHPGAVDSFRSRVGEWPTPQAQNSKGIRDENCGWSEGGKPYDIRTGKQVQSSLDQTVKAMFPPSPPAPATADGQTSSPPAPTSRRRLNPRFVEWLMGFPSGHTEL